MNIFGIRSHLYKKIGGDSIVCFLGLPSRAENRYDNNDMTSTNDINTKWYYKYKIQY